LSGATCVKVPTPSPGAISPSVVGEMAARGRSMIWLGHDTERGYRNVFRLGRTGTSAPAGFSPMQHGGTCEGSGIMTLERRHARWGLEAGDMPDDLSLTGPHTVPTRFWHRLDDGRVQCDVCPRACRLHEGQRGLCFVRGPRRRPGGAHLQRPVQRVLRGTRGPPLRYRPCGPSLLPMLLSDVRKLPIELVRQRRGQRSRSWAVTFMAVRDRLCLARRARRRCSSS